MRMDFSFVRFGFVVAVVVVDDIVVGDFFG